MEQFNQFVLPRNQRFFNEAESFKKELKIKFSEVFSCCLGRCNKMKAKFEKKENVLPVFKKKRNVSFASLKKINDELKLEKMGVLSKVNCSNWASPTVYIKKKSKEIRVCAVFSMSLNGVRKGYHYSLPWLEEVFAQLSRGRIFLKMDLNDIYLQIEVDNECSKLLTIKTRRGM